MENVQDIHWRTQRQRIRKADLALSEVESKANVDECAVVEMQLDHPVLCDNAQVMVPPTGNLENFQQILKSSMDSVTPIIIYGIADDSLSKEVRVLFVEIDQSINRVFSFPGRDATSNNTLHVYKPSGAICSRSSYGNCRYCRTHGS